MSRSLTCPPESTGPTCPTRYPLRSLVVNGRTQKRSPTFLACTTRYHANAISMATAEEFFFCGRSIILARLLNASRKRHVNYSLHRASNPIIFRTTSDLQGDHRDLTLCFNDFVLIVPHSAWVEMPLHLDSLVKLLPAAYPIEIRLKRTNLSLGKHTLKIQSYNKDNPSSRRQILMSSQKMDFYGIGC